MEALACGTPVIAFPNGALPEIIEHAKTGYLVNSVNEMACAIRRAAEISSDACRNVARERFSAETMTARYVQRYQDLVRHLKEFDAFSEPHLVAA
jgi:glycosyltransferase involved in cell wall biosynthesis